MTQGPHHKQFEGVASVFVVQDLMKSLDHYQNVLGFHCEFVHGQPVSYAGVERDGVLIHLQSADRTQRKPGNSAVYVFVLDVDQVFAELEAKGARVVNSPQDYPYGMRDFSITDIDGNQLSFGSETKPAA